SAMSAGIFELQPAAALMIGAKLGTTSTIVVGSLKGSIAKRQMAMAHLLFIIVVSILAMLALPLLLAFIYWLNVSDPLVELVALYSLINFAGILLFLPVITPFQ